MKRGLEQTDWPSRRRSFGLIKRVEITPRVYGLSIESAPRRAFWPLPRRSCHIVGRVFALPWQRSVPLPGHACAQSVVPSKGPLERR